MDFALSQKHEMLRTMFQEFAANEVDPIAAEIDETCEFPLENVKKMGKLGFLGIPFPKEYGGSGGDQLAYVMAIEELSRACATHGVIVADVYKRQDI